MAAGVPGVLKLDKCLIRKMGFDLYVDLYVDLHVVVDGGLSVRDGHQIAHAVRDAIRATDATVADVLVHIEPLD
jgi:divalent metal cation (Fe/Co/Zn/Cd) transporter